MSRIRILNFLVLAIVTIIILTIVSPSVQSMVLTPNNHCVGEISPVEPNSGDFSTYTEIGCYVSAEEATAAIQTEDNQTSDTSGERIANHCVSFLSPITPKSGKFSEVTELGCYDTFAEAVFVATDGVVKIDENINPNELTQEMLDKAGMGSGFSSVIVGQDWDDGNFGFLGGSHQYSAAANCGPGISYAIGSMPSGWNDRVSSARSYSGCDQYNHYIDNNLAGTSITCDMGNTCSTMGVMNNATSSEEWLD